MMDEAEYLDTRAEQLADSPGATTDCPAASCSKSAPRRRCSWRGPIRAPARALAQQQPPLARSSSRCRRVVHPARHERGDALGGDARPGLPHPERALLRPQPHGDAADRPADLAPARLRQRACARPEGIELSLRDLRAPALGTSPRSSSARATAAASSRSQQGTPASGSRGSWARSASRAGAACRSRELLERAGIRGGRRRDAGGPRRDRRLRRRGPGPRPPAAARRRRRSTTRCSPTR